MGYFSKAERRGSLENPGTPLSDHTAWPTTWTSGGKTKSGAQINEATALNLSAVWAAVRVLTDTVASLPLPVYERLEPRGKRRASAHPVYRLLHDRPNPEMSAFTFREVLQGHLATWGNAYAEIERTNGGRPLNLWPITPDKVTPFRRGGRRWYKIDLGDGAETFIDAEHMLHVPGPGFDGLKGYSPISLARESLGLAKATEEFGAMWFGNGSRVSGVLEVPEGTKLSDQGHSRLKESWNEAHQGLSNAHRAAILEYGITWKQIGIPPNDAQFLETRRFQTEEIARWFKVPPHMIQHLERSTFNNIEHQGIEFVVHTARPWFVRWEQTLNHDLFSERERGKFFAEFVIDGLLRGDSEARGTFYTAGINNGWFSPNDVLEMENRNPIPGGERYFVRRDLIPLDSVDKLVESLSQPSEPFRVEEPEVVETRAVPESVEVREQRAVNDRLRLRRSHEPLFRQVADAVVKREVDGIRASLRKAFGGRDAARLRSLVDEFYDSHDEWVAERFLTALLAYAATVGADAAREENAEVPESLDGFIRRYAEVLGRRWTGSSANQLRQLIADTDPEEIEAVVEQRLTEWEEGRAAKEASREVVEAGEAVTAYVWGAVGVTVLKWRATGGSCPLCQRMDGRTVGIEQYFVREGDTVDPEDGETAPLTSKINVRHPPLHGGCDCVVIRG